MRAIDDRTCSMPLDFADLGRRPTGVFWAAYGRDSPGGSGIICRMDTDFPAQVLVHSVRRYQPETA